jgi:hypothetical protein
MRGVWWAELRTAVTGIDPGLERLRLAAIGSASMVLAVAVMSWVRTLTGQPVSLVIFAAVLAMISNLAVNEPGLRRRRTTTLLMLGPAAVAITVGTLLAPFHVVADAVFVAVTVAAVYVRRFGPRGFALGMAAFMPFFLTQFLAARPAELPWLVLAAATGIGATLLLRGVVFAEREERTLARLLRAFRAHLHAYVVAAAGLLATGGGPANRVDAALGETRRRRVRLNRTALLVADRLDRLPADDGDGDKGNGDNGDGGNGDAATGTADEGLGPQLLDTELAAERLAISIRRLTDVGGPAGDDRDALLAGMRGLAAASATGTATAMVPALLDEARRGVATLAAETEGREERTQRVAFAVTRLADALERTETAPALQQGGHAATALEQGHPAAIPPTVADTAAAPRSLRLTTRQALQAGVAVGLAIVVGDLVSPARWYWAAVAAFVVFAGTNSRGDILSRGWQRIVGTAGGVAAGMGLAVVVGGRPLPALALLAVCLFLALYLVRVSQALMAFWITAVLALLYGLTGQFSLDTLLLRIEETAVGAVMGMLAAYLVLPRRTRDAYTEALDDLVHAVDAVVGAAVDRLLGRVSPAPPVELARDMDDALATLRARTAPLVGPWRRTSAGYRDTLHVLAGVDHYARGLARLSDGVSAPDWAPLLQPAADRVRANLDLLRRTPDGPRPDGSDLGPAEELIDAAEAWAARAAETHHRHALLESARLLRRIDQSALALAGDPGDPAPALNRR